MVKIIENALRTVHIRIPKQILEIAFEPIKRNESLDALILSEVVHFRVIPEINVFAGRQKRIPLGRCERKFTPAEPGLTNIFDDDGAVFLIPPDARDYKNISNVIDIEWPLAIDKFGTGPWNSSRDSASIPSALSGMLDSYAPNQSFSTPTPNYLGSNMVRLYPGAYLQNDWVLLCTLEYDTELTNMETPSGLVISSMILAAVKSYIYNKLVISLDEAFLVGGREMATVRRIIDDYATAEEEYEELKLRLRGTETMSSERFDQLLRYMV